MEIRDTSACLIFSKHDNLKDILLPIFDEFTLNTSKYLNFIDFKKAYWQVWEKHTNRYDSYEQFKPTWDPKASAFN